MRFMARPPLLVAALTLFTAVAGAAGQAKPGAAKSEPLAKDADTPVPMARVIWLEPIPGFTQEIGRLPRYRPIPAADARLKDYERFIDTEAGRFARRLVYRAARRFGSDPIFREPVLPIVVREGGNHGEYALAIQTATGVKEHPKLAYVILDPSPRYLGDTILHESGHLVHSMAAGGRRGGSPWSAFPHTTFAVSDPLTALAEGFGIHLETLWGHYGNDPAKRAYYHRTSPSFEPGKGREAEYFSPVDDLMNFAQVWARYQSVRDGMPAFEGYVYPAAYPRSQMDPARDRARLKSPNAMLASEGVAASVMFWIAAAVAQEKGAQPGGGLDQPALVDAEMTLLEAMAELPAPSPDFRPDLLDLVAALGRQNAHVGDIALSRFLDITRGVTARPAIRAKWRTLYENAILLNLADAKAQIKEMDAERGDVLQQARRDVTTLRAGVGPVIPVRAKEAAFELKALGEKMPVEFDLNAMGAAEMALLPGLDAETRLRVERERERAPFASAADFAARTGASLDHLGLLPVDVSGPGR
jgi:hypothetical protein